MNCKKDTKVLTEMIREHIFKRGYIDVSDIKQYIEGEKANFEISNSTIRQILKKRLNARYLNLSALPLEKNSFKNKVYRKYVVELLIKHLAEGDYVISVDETSFSSMHQKARHWVLKYTAPSLRSLKCKTERNVSLLLGVSRYGVEGYCITAGGVNQLVYAEFLTRLIERMKQSLYYRNEKIIILMDNFHAHHTSIIKERAVYHQVTLLFNAPYSPETNYVENVFNKIKRSFKRITRREPT